MHVSTSERTRESKQGSEKHSRVHQNVDGMALVLVLNMCNMELVVIYINFHASERLTPK